MLLTLELTGDDTQTATRAFKLAHTLSFTKCTLHSVEMSLRGDPLVQDWTDTQNGVSRTVHAPIYIELGGLYDSSSVQTYTSTSPTTLIPLGAAEAGGKRRTCRAACARPRALQRRGGVLAARRRDYDAAVLSERREWGVRRHRSVRPEFI